MSENDLLSTTLKSDMLDTKPLEKMNAVTENDPLQNNNPSNYFRWPNFLSDSLINFYKSRFTKIDPLEHQINNNIIDLFVGSISDPLSISIIVLLAIFMYIYFANEFICQLFGLFYPIHNLYKLLHFKVSNKLIKIKIIMSYFIIYGHLELFTSISKIFGLYFYHLKILIIIFLLYMINYRQEWLTYIYNKVIYYDKIISNIFFSNLNKFYDESLKINLEIKRTTEHIHQ